MKKGKRRRVLTWLGVTASTLAMTLVTTNFQDVVPTAHADGGTATSSSTSYDTSGIVLGSMGFKSTNDTTQYYMGNSSNGIFMTHATLVDSKLVVSDQSQYINLYNTNENLSDATFTVSDAETGTPFYSGTFQQFNIGGKNYWGFGLPSDVVQTVVAHQTTGSAMSLIKVENGSNTVLSNDIIQVKNDGGAITAALPTVSSEESTTNASAGLVGQTVKLVDNQQKTVGTLTLTADDVTVTNDGTGAGTYTYQLTPKGQRDVQAAVDKLNDSSSYYSLTTPGTGKVVVTKKDTTPATGNEGTDSGTTSSTTTDPTTGGTTGDSSTDPTTGGATSDPGTTGGTTSDPGATGGTNTDPTTGGTTSDPGTTGSTNTDPTTGGTTSDPGTTGGTNTDPTTGGTTSDPGTTGSTSTDPTTGETTSDPGTTGSTNTDPTTGGKTSDPGTTGGTNTDPTTGGTTGDSGTTGSTSTELTPGSGNTTSSTPSQSGTPTNSSDVIGGIIVPSSGGISSGGTSTHSAITALIERLIQQQAMPDSLPSVPNSPIRHVVDVTQIKAIQKRLKSSERFDSKVARQNKIAQQQSRRQTTLKISGSTTTAGNNGRQGAANSIDNQQKQMIDTTSEATLTQTKMATVVYVDASTGMILTTEVFTGVAGTTIDFDTAQMIAPFQKQGYVVTQDDTRLANGSAFVSNNRVYQVILKRTMPVSTSHQPGTTAVQARRRYLDAREAAQNKPAAPLTRVTTSHRTTKRSDSAQHSATQQPALIDDTDKILNGAVADIGGAMSTSTALADFWISLSGKINLGYSAESEL